MAKKNWSFFATFKKLRINLNIIYRLQEQTVYGISSKKITEQNRLTELEGHLEVF